MSSYTLDPIGIKSKNPYESACINIKKELDFAELESQGIEVIRKICHHYSMSSRRFIMKLLKKVYEQDSEYQKIGRISIGEKSYPITLYPGEEPFVSNLTDEDLNQYIALLMAIAKDNHSSWEQKHSLVLKSGAKNPSTKGKLSLMRLAMGKKEERIPKREAFQIGHALNFDFETMQDYLLRVLDCSGFDCKSSYDQVQRFGFLKREYSFSNDDILEEIHAEYRERTKDIAKKDLDEYSDHTLSAEDGPEYPDGTIADADTVRNQFLDWLCSEEIASGLDCPGNCARTVYTNLLQLIYKNRAGHYLGSLREEVNRGLSADLLHAVWGVTDAYKKDLKRTAYPARLEASCDALVDSFLETASPDNALNYITITQKTSYPVKKPIIKEHIRSLVDGTASVAKQDILIALLLCLGTFWDGIDKTIKILNTLTPSARIKMIQSRQKLFINVADHLLAESFLPAFYAPHPLEFSMLLAIWGRPDTNISILDMYSDYVDEVDRYNLADRTENLADEKVIKATLFDGLRDEIDAQFKSGSFEYSVFQGYDLPALEEHFMAHAQEGSSYLFAEDGVSFLADKEHTEDAVNITNVVCAADDLPDLSIFGTKASDEQKRDRARIIYGLSKHLSLIYRTRVLESTANLDKRVSIRSDYKANCKLTINKLPQQSSASAKKKKSRK